MIKLKELKDALFLTQDVNSDLLKLAGKLSTDIFVVEGSASLESLDDVIEFLREESKNKYARSEYRLLARKARRILEQTYDGEVELTPGNNELSQIQKERIKRLRIQFHTLMSHTSDDTFKGYAASAKLHLSGNGNFFERVLLIA